MRDWRTYLPRLAALNYLAYDTPWVQVFQVQPASSQRWPEGLPSNEAIREFYAICDGGNLNWYEFAPLAELPGLNDQWFDVLDGYYPDGSTPVARGRHLVLATDSGGAPLIWDAATGAMATFYPAGGDWEPLNDSFESLLVELFNTEDPGAEPWLEVLGLVETAA